MLGLLLSINEVIKLLKIFQRVLKVLLIARMENWYIALIVLIKFPLVPNAYSYATCTAVTSSFRYCRDLKLDINMTISYCETSEMFQSIIKKKTLSIC